MVRKHAYRNNWLKDWPKGKSYYISEEDANKSPLVSLSRNMTYEWLWNTIFNLLWLNGAVCA